MKLQRFKLDSIVKVFAVIILLFAGLLPNDRQDAAVAIPISSFSPIASPAPADIFPATHSGVTGTVNLGNLMPYLWTPATGDRMHYNGAFPLLIDLSGSPIILQNWQVSGVVQSWIDGSGCFNSQGFMYCGATLSAGTITDAAIAAGNCVGVTVASVLVGNINCVNSVSVGNDLINTGTSGAPVIAVTNAPTFTGTITDSAATVFNFSGTTTATITNNTTGAVPSFVLNDTNGTPPTGDLLDLDVGGTPQFKVNSTGGITANGIIDSNLTTGNCVGVSTLGILVGNSSCMISLTAGNDINVGSGTAPSVAVTNSPTFAGNLTAGSIIDSGLTSGHCVGASTSGLILTATNCVTSLSASTNIVVGTGETPTVATTNAPTFSGLVTLSSTTPETFSATGGTTITNNATGAVASLTFNSNNASAPTGDLLKLQIGGTNKVRFMNDGGLLLAAAGSGIQPNGASGAYVPEIYIGGANSVVHPQIVTGTCTASTSGATCTFANSFTFASSTFHCTFGIEGTTATFNVAYNPASNTTTSFNLKSGSGSPVTDYICFE